MATGAFFSTDMLSEAADKSLIGMYQLALIAACLSILVPMLMSPVERKLVRPQ